MSLSESVSRRRRQSQSLTSGLCIPASPFIASNLLGEIIMITGNNNNNNVGFGITTGSASGGGGGWRLEKEVLARIWDLLSASHAKQQAIQAQASATTTSQQQMSTSKGVASSSATTTAMKKATTLLEDAFDVSLFVKLCNLVAYCQTFGITSVNNSGVGDNYLQVKRFYDAVDASFVRDDELTRPAYFPSLSTSFEDDTNSDNIGGGIRQRSFSSGGGGGNGNGKFYNDSTGSFGDLQQMPLVDEASYEKYVKVFRALVVATTSDNNNAKISGEKCKSYILSNQSQPTTLSSSSNNNSDGRLELLSRLWSMTDKDGDGHLDLEEFILFMHVYEHCMRDGQLKNVLFASSNNNNRWMVNLVSQLRLLMMSHELANANVNETHNTNSNNNNSSNNVMSKAADTGETYKPSNTINNNSGNSVNKKNIGIGQFSYTQAPAIQPIPNKKPVAASTTTISTNNGVINNQTKKHVIDNVAEVEVEVEEVDDKKLEFLGQRVKDPFSHPLVSIYARLILLKHEMQSQK